MKVLVGDAAWWTTSLVAALTAQFAVLAWFLTRCKSIKRLDAWLHELSGLDAVAKSLLDAAFQAARHRSLSNNFSAALRQYTQASRDLELRLRQRTIATYSFVLAPIASGLAIFAMQFKPQPAIAEWLVLAAVLLLTTECWFGFQIVALEIRLGPATERVGSELASSDTLPTTPRALPVSTFPPTEPSSFNRSTAPPNSHTRTTPVHVASEDGARCRVELDNAWEDCTGCCLLSPRAISGQLALEVGGTAFNVVVMECNEFGTRYTVQVQLCDTMDQPRFRGTLLLIGHIVEQQVGSP